MTRFEIMRLEAKASCEIEALRGFEMSLGYDVAYATRIAVETIKRCYPQIAGSRVFKLAK